MQSLQFLVKKQAESVPLTAAPTMRFSALLQKTRIGILNCLVMRTKRRRDDDEHSVINLIPDDSKRPRKDLGSINLVTASQASAVVSPQTE